jgi:hypothetical protein
MESLSDLKLTADSCWEFASTQANSGDSAPTGGTGGREERRIEIVFLFDPPVARRRGVAHASGASPGPAAGTIQQEDERKGGKKLLFEFLFLSSSHPPV